MVHTPQTQGVDDVLTGLQPPKSTEQLSCEAKGGRWDPNTKTCILPLDSPPIEGGGGRPVVFKDTGKVSDKGRPLGFAIDAREDPALAQQQAIERGQQEITAEGRALAEQGFETQPSPTEESPGLVPGVSLQEAGIVAVRDGVPRALTLAGGAAVAGATIGLAAGPAAPVVSPTLAIAAGAVTFIGSISASMLSNMNSQRTDDVNAQQRVLDEGKQTLNDWVTMAAADPTRRQEARFQFQQQLQLIQDAHVQMVTDTNGDLAKFETAIPNLAEFNTFYSGGGERDALESDMDRALRGQMTPAEVNFRMMELAGRRT